MHEEMTILLAKEGDPSAFRRLYDDHFSRIYSLAFRYMQSPQDAEDVMQETFINAFRAIKSFNFEMNTSFSTWLSRICVNCAIGHLRKRKRRRTDQTHSFSEMAFEIEDSMSQPERRADIRQTLIRIREVMQELSPKQQIIFDMRHIRDYPIKDIADQLHCSQSSVKKHLHRAVTKIRKQMKPLWGEQ